MIKDFIRKISNAFHTNKRNFTIYTFVGGFISVLNVFLMWLFIDIFKIRTIISGIIIVGSLFILKYFIYKRTGFTN
jgi:hypothetical protein